MLYSLQCGIGGKLMALKVRPLTKQEATPLERLAHSRTAPHRVVQRAPIVWASARGETVPAIARQVGLSACRVRAWLHRVNRHSLAGLADAPRSGRTKPQSLGVPCALWPLARLQQALQERHGLWVTPATIWKWLQAEGLAWKRQQSWFHVRVDAAFTEKRGPSSRPIRGRSQSGGSSASTNSGR
jgi:putative transposase